MALILGLDGGATKTNVIVLNTFVTLQMLMIK